VEPPELEPVPESDAEENSSPPHIVSPVTASAVTMIRGTVPVLGLLEAVTSML
jgi:hypothetical protein